MLLETILNGMVPLLLKFAELFVGNIWKKENCSAIKINVRVKSGRAFSLSISEFPFNILYHWLTYYVTYILLMVKKLSFSTTTKEVYIICKEAKPPSKKGMQSC